MALTKKDMEKLADVFATKEDIREELQKYATKEEMNARFDQVNTTLDWLVGAFRDFKDELTVRYGQTRQHNNQLENHEMRIKKIEEKVLV